MKNLYNETLNILKHYNITANKKYGQNFLINESIILEILNVANVSKDDLVIEIGPGLGNLTEYLLEVAGKVVAIELDKKMINVISSRFSDAINNETKGLEGKKLELINEDILNVNLVSLIENEFNKGYKKIKVVANLPYYITTPIIMKLLEEKLKRDSITVMVQKELAERLCGLPGGKETGAITYSIYYYCNANIMINVPREEFLPIPEVDSAVIKFDILKEPRMIIENEKLFFNLIKRAFMMKRKTLINALNGIESKNKEDLINILKELNIKENVRGEELSFEDFVNVYNKIYE